MQNKKKSQVKLKLLKDMYCCFIPIAIFFTTLTLHAQTEPFEIRNTDIKIVNDSSNNRVEIEFKADKKVNNLLVLITDSIGHTFFLDNKYNFKGPYKRAVDFKMLGKGKYFLKVIRDEDKYYKQFTIQ